jgi:DNA-binding transcriptional regulator YhcF (GntR family)
MNAFDLQIQADSSVPKFQQLVDLIVDAVSDGRLFPGDILPSVNHIYYETGLARGTIVKALDELKRRGIIESVPNKGYFVARENPRVLLLLDTLRPFKQVIYDGVRNYLTDNVEVNMYFHHYNIKLMEEILQGAAGRYSAYIIMDWEHVDMESILSKVDPNKVLIFDHVNPQWGDFSYVIQEFETSLLKNLTLSLQAIQKYKKFVFVCPDSANHPAVAKKAFLNFCEKNKIDGKISDECGQDIQGIAFLVVDDKHLIDLVKRARELKLPIGKEVGIISFNDYAMKEVLEGGITVISPDFDHMARLMANSIKKREKIRSLVEPKVLMRNSL